MLLGARKSGHAGTLDPLATGVLVVCVGRATLLSRFLAGGIKEYTVTAELGLTTDTYDTEGRVTAKRGTAGVSREDIEREAAAFIGTHPQVPPPYSAVKLGGKPLYRYARAGASVEPRPRQVTIEDVSITGFESGAGGARAILKVTCGPGTYIRSLIDDIGSRLGCGACVSALRRTRSGSFRIEDAFPLESPGTGEMVTTGALLSLEKATSWMPTIEVTGVGRTAVTQGKPLLAEWLNSDLDFSGATEVFRVLDADGSLIALYGPPRAGDPEEVRGRAVRVIRPNTLRAEDDEAA
jgi:tRNA pseudouridine55 synthase